MIDNGWKNEENIKNVLLTIDGIFRTSRKLCQRKKKRKKQNVNSYYKALKAIEFICSFLFWETQEPNFFILKYARQKMHFKCIFDKDKLF